VASRVSDSPDAIIAGAGGAAKAAILALKDLNYNVFIINRTDEKAESLAQKFDVQWAPHTEVSQLLKRCGLIVYTIDHMLPGMESLSLRNQIIFEANYRSPLFNKRECKSYISGKEWLIHQAIPSFCLFTQSEPNRESMFNLADNC
jgi:shikimate 5-dehydrogenase